MSSTKGNHDHGNIYKTDENGENLEIIYHFEGEELGAYPVWGLTQHADGRIYGMGSSGGMNGLGFVYSISPIDYSFQIHHHFETSTGAGSLTEATNGKLYGFGYLGQGILYELDPITNEFQIIHNFSTDGRVNYHNNQLLEVYENVLYGVTERGGSVNDDGVIFKYDINTSTYEVLYEFDRTQGYRPKSLRNYGDGLLYGMTSWTDGSIFNFDPQTNEVIKIFDYPSTNGLIGDVLLGLDGLFYGITATGGSDGHGSIFQVNTATDQFTTLHNFLEFSGPHIPEAPLIQASNGKFYGNTRYISRANAGITIFEYDPVTSIFRVTDTETNGFSFNPLIEVSFCPEDEVSVSISACDEFTFDGQVLTASGNYEAIIVNQFGCDSLVTLDLTILVSPSSAVTENGVVLIAENQSGVTWQWYNCNTNQPLEGETKRQLNAQESGNYAVKVDNGDCISMSECFEVMFPLATVDTTGLLVYPSPMKDQLTIELPSFESMVSVRVTDINGKEVFEKSFQNTSSIPIRFQGKDGMYLIRIESEKIKATLKIVKAI